MQATRRLGTFHRILNALRARFGKRKTARSAPRVVASTARPVGMPQRVATPAARAPVATPVPAAAVPQPMAAPAAVPAPVAAPVVQSAELDTEPAPLRPMRTLEEVRADLARLRASAKERHAMAQVVVKRDTAFEATDFMDFTMPSSAPAPAPAPVLAPSFVLPTARPAAAVPAPVRPVAAAPVPEGPKAPEAEVHDRNADEEFEPTAYLDFTTITPLPGR